MEGVVAKYFTPWTSLVIGLVVTAALGLAYTSGRIGLEAFVFAVSLTLASGVVSSIFLRRMAHPDGSVEQMLYKTDHPTRP